jgi:hypothetical protein
MRTAGLGARAAALLGAMVAAVSGCLSTTHEVPLEELYRLSYEPEEEWSAAVRVKQQYSHQSEPPPAPRVHAGTTVVIDGPVSVGGQPRPAGRPGGAASNASSTASNLAELKAESAKALLIAAAAVGVGLAATRGARYDGWVELHPMHPVHLVGPAGEYTYVPLSQITPDTADWARRAYVREDEGPWRRLGRRPLDRGGFTYGFFLGSGELAVLDEDPRVGFLGRVHLGYHPNPLIGLGIDLGFGWTDDGFDNTIFDGRYAAQLSAYPFRTGRLHGGFFGQLGAASRSDDGLGHDDGSRLFGGGVLLQLDVTTHFALAGRAGITRAYGESLSDVGIGIHIY